MKRLQSEVNAQAGSDEQVTISVVDDRSNSQEAVDQTLTSSPASEAGSQRSSSPISQDQSPNDSEAVSHSVTSSPTPETVSQRSSNPITQDQSPNHSVASSQDGNSSPIAGPSRQTDSQKIEGLFQRGGASNRWIELTRSLGLKGKVTLGNVTLEIHKVKVSKHGRHSIHEEQFQIRVQPIQGQEPLLSSIEGAVIQALRKILDHLKESYPDLDYYGKYLE